MNSPPVAAMLLTLGTMLHELPSLGGRGRGRGLILHGFSPPPCLPRQRGRSLKPPGSVIPIKDWSPPSKGEELKVNNIEERGDCRGPGDASSDGQAPARGDCRERTGRRRYGGVLENVTERPLSSSNEPALRDGGRPSLRLEIVTQMKCKRHDTPRGRC
jgi:hypothetical protein